MERREYLKQLLINSQNHLIVIQHVHINYEFLLLNWYLRQFCSCTNESDEILYSDSMFHKKWYKQFWFDKRNFTLWQFFHFVVQNNSSAQITNFTLQIFSFPAQHKPSNDAASSPHQGNTSKVQLPSQVFGSFSHQHKALGIGHYLRGIQGLQNKTKNM